MKIRDNFLIAVKSLLRRPLRTIIVLQGVIWGVALTVFPASLREGAYQQARLRAQELGIDRVSIQVQDPESGDALTVADCDAVNAAFGPGGYSIEGLRVLACAPVKVMEGRIVETADKKAQFTADIVMTSPESEEARSFRVARGRYFTRAEMEKGEAVCVLEALAARELFGDADPIGQSVRVSYLIALPEEIIVDPSVTGTEPRYTVIGVMEKRSEEQLNTDDYGFRDKGDKGIMERFTKPLGLLRPKERWKRSETAVHVPLLLSEGAATKVDWILLRAANAEKTRQLEQSVNDFLVERGHKVAVYGNLFYPMLIENEKNTSARLYLAIMIACMIMSGLAIVNTMLISVIERSREIAIRRTEGARRRDIAAQFVTESAVMCFIGAILGVPVGLGLAWANILFRPRFHSFSAVAMPWGELALVIVVALFVGVIAGLLPARRAAKVEPVVILSRGA